MRSLLLAAFALLAACGGDGGNDRPAPAPGPVATDASAWELGPIIDGKNYSHGLRPSPNADGTWSIVLPVGQDGVHYVTTSRSLAGATSIKMRYRVDAAAGARIVASTSPTAPGIIALYFQRCGDNWSGDGKFESYRWWATFAAQSPIEPGVHEIAAPLEANWTAVMTSSRASNPTGFRDAVANTCRVGFTLGGGTGYGHGVFAAGGPVSIVVEDFRVE